MLGCKPSDTPIEHNLNFDSNDGDTPMERGRYQRLVGKLINLYTIQD